MVFREAKRRESEFFMKPGVFHCRPVGHEKLL
jgi:hypothetical protein